MGYSTDYYGSFSITPAPSAQEIEAINSWLTCRHVKRYIDTIYRLDPDADSHTIDGNPVGENGWNWIEAYVSTSGDAYEPMREAVADYNDPAPMPSLWSDLEIESSVNGTVLKWNGSEKSYEIPAWIRLLIENVFAPAGYVLDGEMDWQGEDSSDTGTITVTDNEMHIDY